LYLKQQLDHFKKEPVRVYVAEDTSMWVL